MKTPFWVSPAHAGVEEASSSPSPAARGQPRARGGRGHPRQKTTASPPVSPAHAGVEAQGELIMPTSTSQPRARGGRGSSDWLAHGGRTSAPRTRG